MDERHSRMYVWVWPSDCVPVHGLDLMPGSYDDMKVKKLKHAFSSLGFDPREPALIGYPKDGKVQLLTGAHQYEAAYRAHVMLPVSLRLRSDVEKAWGTPAFLDLISETPVCELEYVKVIDHPVKRVDAALVDRVTRV